MKKKIRTAEDTKNTQRALRINRTSAFSEISLRPLRLNLLLSFLFVKEIRTRLIASPPVKPKGVALVLLLLLFTYSVSAQPLIQHPQLDEYIEEAAENNPALRAQFERYQESIEEVPQAGSLPDPELEFSFMINPNDYDGVGIGRVSLMQMFPWFGTLSSREEAAALQAKAAFEAFQQERNQLIFEVKELWHQLYEIDRSIRIVRENIELLETFESLAESKYEAAVGSQADVLRLSIEIDDLQNQLQDLYDDQSVMNREFNALLNRDDTTRTTIVADSLKPKTGIADSRTLMEQAVENNAALNQMGFEADAGKHSINAARKEGLPDIGLGIGWERNMAAMDSREGFLMPMGSIRIPINRKKYKAMRRQAERSRNAVLADRENLENNLATELEEVQTDYREASRRTELYGERQIQRTRQVLDILTDQYASDRADFEEIIRLQRNLLEYQLDYERAVVNQHTALARIEMLTGAYNLNEKDSVLGRD